MARKQLRAEFFMRPDGVAIPKAPPLKRAHAFRIYNRDRGICQRCGAPVTFGGKTVSPFRSLASGEIDHKLARSRGGQNDDANLELLCITCNAQKGAA